VALEIATRWPELVEKLVLLCADWEAIEPDPELRSFVEEEDRLLTEGEIDGAVDLSVKTWLGADASADHRSLVARMQRGAFEIQLGAGDDAVLEHEEVDPGAVRAGALVISGAQDFPHFRDVAAALTERIPGAEHRQLDWAGHLPSLEQPDLVDGLLLDHLSA
jgi:pimeloyl-ACP methyl ester carboxylesterase